MKLSKLNQYLLTLLYSISLIQMSIIIFGGSRYDTIEMIISYLFYGFSVITILKALGDLVTMKQGSQLIFLVLSVMPIFIYLLYLIN